MKYDQLKNFILNEMKMQERKNYQPVMIRYLNQNRGKATKKEIQEALHQANLEYPAKYFQDSPVFDVLTTSHQVADYNSKEDTYYLFDYDTFTPAQKAHITMYCDEKIRDSANPINPRIILFSVAGQKSFEHFNETITTDVISNTLPGSTILKNFQAVRVWGSIYNTQNFSKWKELKKGDILLFYHNKKYITSAFLDGTEQNQELADHLWGYKDEESKKTFELMLYMSPAFVFNADVDYQKLNRLFGYEKEFMPTRILDFTTVNKNKTDELIEKFGSLENALKTIGFSFNENFSIYRSATSAFLSEKDFEKMIDCIPEITKLNKSKLLGSQKDKIPNPEDIQLCARLQYYCALRITELLKITLKDINLENYEINIGNRNDPNSFTNTTIHPTIKNDLEKYLKDKPQNEILISFSRQLLASYYKKAGEFAKLNLFKEQTEREIEGMYTSILRDSRGRHMLEKGAGEGLTRLKLRIDNDDPLFNFDKHTLQELKDWEKSEYENTLNVIKTNTNYLLLRHSTKSVNQWRDTIGKKYHYGIAPNYTKLVPGTKTIWYDRENGDFYYWGHGDISKIEKETEDRRYANFDNFNFFNAPQKVNPKTEDIIPKKGLDSTKEKIMNLPGWNNQISILEITKDIYDEIINGKSVATYLKNKSLSIPTTSELKLGIEKIQDELLIDSDTIQEIVINLASGRHVLLAGPVGTGKTQLAILIPKTFWVNDGGYYSEVHTATADWSTQDVIGGIVPKMVENNVKYEIQHGCVTETILDNWDTKACQNRIKNQHEGHTYNGTWLVIDEFNRADIDKAFGPLFTSLETRALKIPSDKEFESQIEIKIPKDYRIIGTLNTADKHYLFRLSDALKRRFAYIEVASPSRKQKDNEIFYALKNAIRDLSSEEKFEWFSLKESEKVIDEEKSNKEFLAVLNNAYDVLDFIRASKPLGTAILKSIYQTLLIGSKITDDFNKSLDLSLNTNLIPQLENVQTTTLETIVEFFTGDVTELFKEKQDSPIRERYVDDFKMILSYVGVKGVNKKVEKYSKGELKEEDAWNSIKSRIDEKRLNVKLNVFPKSIRELIKASTLI